ncbi:MAG: Hsp33 family molecular chaperone HslO [Clostridia bacterium]|nr:Hsp33 family molecular chaperone HslO [Clostridia bacterium]
MNIVLNAIDKSRSFRVYLVISTEMVEEARKIHGTSPLATAALGRTLTGAGIMGLLLKNPEDKLTVSFKGEGPAKQILATANAKGEVKGYIANPYVELPLNEKGKLDVGGALGLGQLTVIKDLGLKEPYVGTIDLVSGEIAEDLTAYYYISEQQNTSIALGVKIDKDLSVKCAGGMFIQMLPDFEEGAVDELERLIADMKPITTSIEEVMGEADEYKQVEALLKNIFEDIDEKYSLDILDTSEISWKCGCSKEGMAKALMTIGKKDLTEIYEEDGQAELTCQFCESSYVFSKDELKEMLDRM